MAGNNKFFKIKISSSPKSSKTYKLPVIFKPVKYPNLNAKKYDIKIAAKKDGIDIPKILKNEINLSNKLSLKYAEIIPKGIAKNKAIKIDVNDKTNVLGNVFSIKELIDLSF